MLPLLLLTGALASEPVPGVDIRMVEHRERSFAVVTVDLRLADLALVGQTQGLQDFDALGAWLSAQSRRLVAVTNAGIYDTSFSPLGYQVEQGVEVHRLNTSTGHGNFYLKPNGVFFIDEAGAHVVETSACCQATGDVRLATQSGPLILSGSQLHPALRERSPNLELRSGVGVSDAHTVHLVISDGVVRFWDLATLFRDVLGCTDALYLDGVISALRAEGLPAHLQVSGRYGGMLVVSAPIVEPHAP